MTRRWACSTLLAAHHFQPVGGQVHQHVFGIGNGLPAPALQGEGQLLGAPEAHRHRRPGAACRHRARACCSCWYSRCWGWQRSSAAAKRGALRACATQAAGSNGAPAFSRGDGDQACSWPRRRCRVKPQQAIGEQHLEPRLPGNCWAGEVGCAASRPRPAGRRVVGGRQQPVVFGLRQQSQGARPVALGCAPVLQAGE